MSKAGGIQYLLKHGRAASPVTTRTSAPALRLKTKKMAEGGLSSLKKKSKFDDLTEAQLAALPNEYRDAMARYFSSPGADKSQMGMAYFYDPDTQTYTPVKPAVKTDTQQATAKNPILDTYGPGDRLSMSTPSYGGGYTNVGGTTSATGGGIAANPMGIDPAQAQGQGLFGGIAPGSTTGGTIGGVSIGALGDPASAAAEAAGDTSADAGADGYARGGIASLGAYSDGGQLLRGPGDGVSDSIPARIGSKQQARLADGEFVVPARIVSELGNGSTEAGARKLYAMMARIQQGRKKTMKGKDAFAKDSKAEKHLPA